jgi:hypothetical protein
LDSYIFFGTLFWNTFNLCSCGKKEVID